MAPFESGTGICRQVVARKGLSGYTSLLFAVFLLIPVPAHSQASSGILDPNRATDWTKAGIPGDIPHYTTICRIILPSGKTDSTDMTNIQNSLQACSGTNQVVQLQAGTYTISGGLNWYNASTDAGATNVVLRGAGPDKTKLVFTGVTSCSQLADVCVKGNKGYYGNPIGGSANWTGGYQKGSNSLTVSSTSGLRVGQIVILDQRNDTIGMLPATGTPTVTATGTGSTTYTYVVQAIIRNGLPYCSTSGGCPTVTSASVSVSNASSLSSAVYNTITVGYVPYSTTCNIYQTAPSARLIGSASCSSNQGNSVQDTGTGTAGAPATPTVVGMSESGSTVTITTSIPHGFSVGQTVGIGPDKAVHGVTFVPDGYDGQYTVTAVSNSTTFQYTDTRTGLPASGGEYATVDTGGAYMCDITGICIESNANYLGRTCPNNFTPNASCASGEISLRSQTEVKKITAINGNQITVDPPLEMNNWRASQSPGLWWTGSNYAEFDGIENMTLDFTSDGHSGSNTWGVEFFNAYESWMKNVRSIDSSAGHVKLYLSGRIDILDSYFFGRKRGGTQSYGTDSISSSDNLIQNNIFQHVQGPTNELDFGSVYGYNYLVDTAYINVGWMMPNLYSNHGFNGFTLYEGNDANATVTDNDHGTSIGMTLFRNRLRGQDTPIDNQSLLAAAIRALNRGVNYIGNILGTQGTQTIYQDTTKTFPTNAVYALGVSSFGASPIPPDPLVAKSLLRWGNYDTATGQVRFAPTEIPTDEITFLGGNPVPFNTTLPSSFYLSAAPAFWQTPWGTPPWPAIGPDVTQGNASDGVAGHSYSIPAQLCYTNTRVDPAYQQSLAVTQATYVGSEVTLTIGPNNLIRGDTVIVSGIAPPAYNGSFQVSAQTPTTISYWLPANPGTYISGGTVKWPNILLFSAASCYPNANNGVRPPTSLHVTVEN